MKITPSNQTLILAADRRGSGVGSGTSADKSASATGSVLQRVTIVAARPDTTVLYLQADYSPASAATAATATYAARLATSVTPRASSDVSLPAQSQSSASTGTSSGRSLVLRQSANGTRDAHGNAFSGSFGLSSYLHPVELYAQTQRILEGTARVQQVDVLA